MRIGRALLLLPLLVGACVTSRTRTTTWGEPHAAAPPPRYGHVAWIRETVHEQRGNPAGGAAVGAVVGGLLGHAMTHHSGGTLVGAVGGAAVGASASQGGAEYRSYEVAVRFDDGEQRVFLYRDYSPFAVGDAVSWSAVGLQRLDPGVPGELPPPPPPPPPPAYLPPAG